MAVQTAKTKEKHMYDSPTYDLVLTKSDARHVREGLTVIVDDASGRAVDVSMHRYPRDGRPRLEMSEVSLDATASPAGLICRSYTDPDRSWTVRVAS